MRPLASGKALQAGSLLPAHLVEFFNTGSQQAAWHRLTDAAWVATYRATTSDTVTTVPQLSGDSREAFRRVSRKCRIRHPHAIGREIPPRGLRPYRGVTDVSSPPDAPKPDRRPGPGRPR